MNFLSKSRRILILAIAIASFSFLKSCDQKDTANTTRKEVDESKKFKVALLSQKGNISELSKVLITYSVPKAGKVLANLAGVIDELTKEIFGGVGVDGKLFVNNSHLEFKPGTISNFFMDNVETIKIPISDVDSVTTERYMLLAKLVVIHTKNGRVKFQAKNKDWYNPFGYNDGQIKDFIDKKRLK